MIERGEKKEKEKSGQWILIVIYFHVLKIINLSISMDFKQESKSSGFLDVGSKFLLPRSSWESLGLVFDFLKITGKIFI